MIHLHQCNQNTYEAIWNPEHTQVLYYRCQYCVDHADPKNTPCPKCGCRAHETTCITFEANDQGYRELQNWVQNKERPDEQYTCLNCGFKWYTPDFEKYLLSKIKGAP